MCGNRSLPAVSTVDSCSAADTTTPTLYQIIRRHLTAAVSTLRKKSKM